MLEYPSRMPCGKVIIKECDCPKHNRHTSVGSYTSLDSMISDFAVINYWCTRCYRQGIIMAVKRWS